jgi:hypothetical protein
MTTKANRFPTRSVQSSIVILAKAISFSVRGRC